MGIIIAHRVFANPHHGPVSLLSVQQYLVEKILRSKIYDCQYWKEHCFGLTGNNYSHFPVPLISFSSCMRLISSL